MVFNVRWRPEITADMVASVLADTGLTDIFPGSVLSTILLAPAVEDARQYASMQRIIAAFSVDTMSGVDLDNKLFDLGLDPRIQPQQSTGLVTIVDISFTKIQTRIYPGLPGPIAGQTTINIVSATGLTASGTVIVGRGTSNVETVAYSSITQVGGYYQLNLTSGLVNDHGTEESIILSQGGNRVVNSGTIVQVPANDATDIVSFSIDEQNTILDGEDTVDGVKVTCVVGGIVGNVPAGTIVQFGSLPFPTATVTNLLPFVNGTDLESDEEVRNRIKNSPNASVTGTKKAILAGITGLVDDTENKRVVSATFVDAPAETTLPSFVYIDDGTGFEPSFDGSGLETIFQEAAGTETVLNLENFPLVKASLVTDNFQPYNVSGGDTLIIDVDGSSETITFQSSDFNQDGSALAREIVTRINNDSNLVEARTTDGNTKVIITVKAETNERLQILGGTGNTGLGFVSNTITETLRLYKNDLLLAKDGRPAIIETNNVLATMDFTGGPFTFDIQVDGNTSNTITVTISASDFAVPASPTMPELLAAINDDLVGATATGVFNDTVVRITSNKGNSSASQLNVQAGGSALGVTKLDFTPGLVVGVDQDYTLNRFNGQIHLTSPLVALDKVEAGSRETRAFLDCVSPEPYNIGAGETLVVQVDGSSDKTFTFIGGAMTAQAVIDEITAARFTSNNLNGVGFEVIDRGGINYLRIRTNTFDSTIGSIFVNSSSTALALDFLYDTVIDDQSPNVAYAMTQDLENYTQGPSQNLVVEMDGDPVNRTFDITLHFAGTVTTQVSTTVFRDSSLPIPFTVTDQLKNAVVRFDNNTTTVALQGIARAISAYNESTGQVTTSAFPASPAVGDTYKIIPVTALNVSEMLKIKQISTLGIFSEIDVVDQGRRVQIASLKNGSDGEVHVLGGSANNLSIPFSSDGTAIGTFSVDSIQGLSTGLLAIVDDGDSSPLNVTITNITGALAPFTIEVDSGLTDLSAYTLLQSAVLTDRQQLNFSTSIHIGVDGYKYFTGLLQRVQKTIDGYDADLVNFPGLKAAGVRIGVSSPVIQKVAINIDVTPEQGVTLSSIDGEVKSVIASYINSLKVGEDMILAEIINRVMDISGVKDARIISPTSNSVVQDNELARIDLVDITVG